ncbi:hypothetical protein [Peptostreptococcus sp. D1]|uniref:hypothetical protein n=1 Tax=Peptostreptococcus sp. D1 TaxID=72304 RepID=UPI0008E36A89|nr:hypothetical protein [Peptostreptococcus sp. D1]SFE92515.1 hypothetical protein SAMN02910278_02086 [Peptostreptococcus sp. D1]
MKRYGIFSCGHKDYIEINSKNSWKYDTEEKIKEHFEDNVCDKCRKERKEKLRNQEYEKALKNALKQELPELKGSEKQIRWAMTIREEIMSECKTIGFAKRTESIINKLSFSDNEDEYRLSRKLARKENKEDIVKEAYYNVFYNNTSSRMYIEDTLFDEVKKELFKLVYKEKFEQKEEMKMEIKKEATVVPSGNIADSREIEVYSKDDTVYIKSFMNETLRLISRDYGFVWNSQLKLWEKKIKEMQGNISDRIADVSNAFLNKGFIVVINDSIAREKAINGTYEAEHRRWIDFDNELLIVIHERNDNIYKSSRKIKGSKWDGNLKVVTVPLTSYLELEDLANKFDFRYTARAKKEIEMKITSLSDVIKEIEVGIEKKYKNKVSEEAVFDSLKDEE